jgi:hypothetical protein
MNITGSWPRIQVEIEGMPRQDIIIPPAQSPFRRRLFECSSLKISWDLLNGRFVRRPPL